ncbi:MAG: hypothetical protein H7Z38_22420 [Rubrivivax sp.]|nr:hypothetical protein [Pyrinomonadaceae bacterium]
MSGGKCARCGLVNWPDAQLCGRCDARLGATDSAATRAVAGEGSSWRRTSTKWQAARSLMWAIILYLGLVSMSLALMGLYDWITGAAPRPTGPPHSFPKNPFFFLVVLVIYSAPVTYLIIAALLFRYFKRREAAG